MHDEKRMQSASQHAPGHDLESALDKRSLRIAVPIFITHTTCCHRDQRILHPCSNLPLRANMFEEQQVAPWFEHAPDLMHAALWITHRTEDEGDNDTVEMSIGKREYLD